MITDSSKNAPTTNKASESDFAILDLLLRTKPNASMQTLLALTMRARNHTLEWSSNKDPKEKDRILNLARVKNQDMKEKYKTRAEVLKLKKKKKILAKQREKEEVQEKQLKKKADAVNSLVSLGVRAWLSEE